MRPTLLHDGAATGAAGSVLGFVDTTNCHVLDVPRLSLLAHCPRCRLTLGSIFDKYYLIHIYLSIYNS